MLQEILSLLPGAVTGLAPSMLIALAGGGAVLGWVGGRYSRPIVTLTAVAAGTWLGLHAPAWFGLKLDGMGAAFCGAIACGTAGFLLHRTCIGLLLSALLTFGTGAATWFIRAGATGWTVPHLDLSQPAPAILSQIWASLPAGLYPALPIALCIASAAGTLLAAFAPKLSRALFYSLFGITLMTLSGSLAIQKLVPQWLSRVPANPITELAIFGAAVFIAICIQWLLMPRMKTQSATEPDKTPRHNIDPLDPDPAISPIGTFPMGQKRLETAARRQRAFVS